MPRGERSPPDGRQRPLHGSPARQRERDKRNSAGEVPSCLFQLLPHERRRAAPSRSCGLAFAVESIVRPLAASAATRTQAAKLSTDVNRSQPISRVLLRRGRPRYDRHSSRRRVAGALQPPTRGLGEQRRRPPIWRCSGWRLPRFTRPACARRLVSVALFLAFTGARATAYSGRALPGILLCGARTFLSLANEAAAVWLASDDSLAGRAGRERRTARAWQRRAFHAIVRQRIASPARKGTTMSSPKG